MEINCGKKKIILTLSRKNLSEYIKIKCRNKDYSHNSSFLDLQKFPIPLSLLPNHFEPHIFNCFFKYSML